MSNPQPTRLNSFLGYALLCGAGIVVVVMARRLGLWHGDVPGPGLYPFFVSCGMVLIGVIGMIAAMLRSSPGTITPGTSPAGRLRIAVYLISLLAYAALLNVIGFYLATALVLLVILKFVERLDWIVVLAAIAGIVIVVYLIFTLGFGVSFPTGSLWRNLL
jgi:hypothetical protein